MSDLALFAYTSVSRPRRVQRGVIPAVCDRVPPPTQIVRVADESEKAEFAAARPDFVRVEFRQADADGKDDAEALADLSLLF
jgi:hypothetical protein